MIDLSTLTDEALGQKAHEEEEAHNRAHHAISELFKRHNARIVALEERITQLEARLKG